jgi:hypothetical protein
MRRAMAIGPPAFPRELSKRPKVPLAQTIELARCQLWHPWHFQSLSRRPAMTRRYRKIGFAPRESLRTRRNFLSDSVTRPKLSCNSSSSSTGVPCVYYVALLLDSNRVGYLIACCGGLLRRIGCGPLTAGQRIDGLVEGNKFSFPDRQQDKELPGHHVAIHRLPRERQRSGCSSNTAVAPRLADTAPSRSNDQAQGGSTTDTIPNAGAVAFSAEARGADIFVDGKFVGNNTPSVIQLAPGPHEVRIEASGQQPWTRTLDVYGRKQSHRTCSAQAAELSPEGAQLCMHRATTFRLGL